MGGIVVGDLAKGSLNRSFIAFLQHLPGIREKSGTIPQHSDERMERLALPAAFTLAAHDRNRFSGEC
jgi:hypothetical protein